MAIGTVKLRIFRFDPLIDSQPRYETYEVPRRKKMVVGDALRYVQEIFDPSLAFQWECRAGICGTCSLLMNGNPVLACRKPIEDFMVIEPLSVKAPYLAIMKDLVVERGELLKVVRKIPCLRRQDLQRKQPEPIELKKVKQLKEMEECIECLNCVVDCPTSISNKTNFAPAFFPKTYRWIADPRDQDKNKRYEIIKDNLWSCTTCQACSMHCQEEINIINTVVEMRSHLVERGLIPGPLGAALTNIYKYGNPWGGSRNRRDQWAKDLRVDKFPNGNKTNTLYFVGCTASYDHRVQEVAKAVAQVFDKAQTAFGILGNEETCCGSCVLRLGEKGLFEMLRDENIKKIKEYGPHRVVTTSPHCYDVFTKDYSLREEKAYVQHYTQLIANLIDKGKLRFSKGLKRRVAYHDPCFLARYNKIYEEPRKILESIPGVTLLEMARSKQNTFCCGGGGGQMWTEETKKERPSLIRVDEALSFKPDIIATACPFCLINLEDAVKVLGKEKETKVKDIAELVRQVL